MLAIDDSDSSQPSLKIRSFPVSRSDGRLLDAYYPVPMEWRTEGRKLVVTGRSFASEVDLDAIPGAEIPLWVVDNDPEAFHPSLSNLLRILIGVGRLIPSSLLVHSSSIVVDGKAVLLYGRSGAGKTTSGRLARMEGLETPSDDLNFLGIPVEGPVRLQGFPFSGDFGQRSWKAAPSYPLSAILRLEKAEEAGVLANSRASAVAGLASCAAFMNGEPALRDELLEILQRLVSLVPVYTLRFRKDSSFLPLLRRVLAQ